MVRIPLPAGGTLEGLLDEPAQPTLDSVVVCHPHPAFGGRMSTPLVSALAQALTAAGHRVLRFHFRGIEGSDGEATGGLVEHDDVLAAHRFLVDQGARRVAWVGYSFGALMAWRAIDAGGRPAGYVGIALPTSIVEGDPVRIAALGRSAAAGVPSLFLSGELDPLCDAVRLRQWLTGGVVIETLPGEAHTFSLVGTRGIVRRTVAFVNEVLQ